MTETQQTKSNGVAKRRRPYKSGGTGNVNLTHVRVGAWWRLAEHVHASDPKRSRVPRQVAEIDRSDPLLPRVRWAPTPGRRGGRNSIEIGTLLACYVPCDPPAAEIVAPKPSVVPANIAWPGMRSALREEIGEAFERFVAALRPAIREEARRAINEAFAQGGSVSP